MVKNIGVFGNPGSFSGEAAEYYCYKNNIRDRAIKYLISAENVLQSLDEQKINLGIFPIENSNAGVVYDSLYAISRHIFVVREIFEIDVQHCLISRPEFQLSDTAMIVSHPQGFKQCKLYLKRRWPKAELLEWSDTAGAVKAIAAAELPVNAAAIASKKAAEMYGMKILEEGIQDLKFNFTAFLAAIKD